MKHKLKKFASFLLTGKAATLPFFANSSLAQEPILTTTPTAQEATQNNTLVSMVLTNLRDGDEVYIAASTDKDALEYLKIDRQFRLGTDNFQILSQFQFDSADSVYYVQTNGDGSYTVSVPVDLNQVANNEFYLQAVVVKADGSWAFSALEQVTLNRTIRRRVRGECSGPYGGTPPVAEFTFSPATVETFKPVQLDASQSYDSNGSIVDYAWAGQELYGMTPVASFSAPGEYPIRLTVTDNEGCTDTVEKTVTVIPPPEPPEPSELCVNDNETCIAYLGERTKYWGDSLDVLYQFKGFNPASYYDIYIAFAMPGGEFFFLEPHGAWFTSPDFVPYDGEHAIPYLSNTLIPDRKGSVLSIDYIPDGITTGVYTFYVIAVLVGKDPFNFLNHDVIPLSVTDIIVDKKRPN